MRVACAFHPYLKDSMWCPVCSCWPAHPSACDHTLSRGVTRRGAAAKDNSGPPRAVHPPWPHTCRHVCVESMRPRRYVVRMHIPSPLLMNHTTAPPHHHHQNPSNLQPRASEEKHRSREGVVFIVPVCMFTSLIHSGRSGGEKKEQCTHWTQYFS